MWELPRSWTVMDSESIWELYASLPCLPSFPRPGVGTYPGGAEGARLGRGAELRGEDRVLLEATRPQGHLVWFWSITHLPSVLLLPWDGFMKGLSQLLVTTPL